MAFPQVGVEAVIKGLNDYLNGMGKIDRANAEAGGSAEKTTGLLSRFGGALLNVGKVTAIAAVAGVSAVGGAMAALGKSSVSVAAEFQDSMAILETAAASSGESIDELSDAAIAVGGDTRILGASASGAAEAMTGLYKSGLSTTTIFGDLNSYMNDGAELGGALRASFDLAAATELDVAQAADLATVALAAFGGEMTTDEERARFINDALNNFVQAADASTAEVGDLAEAMQMVAPAVGGVGADVSDVNNALAILSTRGITGSMAGTALNSMFSSLRDTTPQATETLDAMNIAIRDTDGAMLPLPTIIGNFETALAGATDAERDAALGAIFTTQGLRAMDTLVKEGTGGWNDMAEATASAATIQEQAAIRGATLSGALEALDGTLETVKIQIGTALIPVITQLVLEFTAIIEQHGPMLVAAFEAIAQFATETLIPAIGEIVTWLAENIPVAIEAASEIWRTVFQPALQFVSDFITETVIPVIGEIIAVLQETLPIAIQAARDYWDTVWQPIVDSVVKFIRETLIPAIGDVVDWLIENIPTAIQTAADFWNTTLLPALETVSNFIAETVIPTIGDVVTWLQENIPAAIEEAAEFWDTVLKPAMDTVADFITETVIPAISDIVTWLEENLPTALQEAADFWNEILYPAIEAVATYITENVVPAVETIITWLEENLPVAVEAARHEWEEVFLPALETVTDFISETFGDIIAWFEENWPLIQETAATVFGFLQSDTTESIGTLIVLWEGLKIAIAAVWTAIETVVRTALDLIFGIVETAMHLINGDWDEAWGTIKETATNIWDDLKEGFQTFVDNVAGALGSGREELKEIWGNIWESFQTIVKTKFADIKQAIVDKLGELKAEFDKFPQKLLGVGEAIVDNIKQGINNSWEGFISWMKDKLGIFSDLLPFSEPKDRTSPLYNLAASGRAIVHNLMDGVAQTLPEFQDLMEELVTIGATAFGELAGLFGDVSFGGRGFSFSSLPEIITMSYEDALETAQYALLGVVTWRDRFSEIRKGYEQALDLQQALIDANVDLTSLLGEQNTHQLSSIEQQEIINELMHRENLLARDQLMTAEEIRRARDVQRLREINEEQQQAAQHQALLLELQQALINSELDISDILAGRNIWNIGEIDVLRIQNELLHEQQNIQARTLMSTHEMVQLQEERRRLETQLTAEREQQLRLQEEENRLQFLREQIDLIKTIEEEELNADAILQGLTLGLEAGQYEVTEAMIRLTRALVDKANEELQAGSPAKALIPTGEAIDTGIAAGILSAMGAPLAAVELLSRQLVAMPQRMQTAPPIIQQGDNFTMNFGGNTISNDVGLSRFENAVRRIIRQEVGGRIL